MNILQLANITFRSKQDDRTKFTYSPLGKAFQKHKKSMEEQGTKQTEDLKNLNLANEKVLSIRNFVVKVN